MDGPLLILVLPQIQLRFTLVIRVGDALSCFFVRLVAGSVETFVGGIVASGVVTTTSSTSSSSTTTTVVHLIVIGHCGTTAGLLFTVVTTAGRFCAHFSSFGSSRS